MDRDRLLRKLLIDGYVAYEKIYNKQSQLIGYNELEPTTLTTIGYIKEQEAVNKTCNIPIVMCWAVYQH